MSKLNIKDIPYLDSITSNPTGGFGKISLDDEFGIDEKYLKFKGKVALEAKFEKDSKFGFGYDYAYLYGAITSVGKNSQAVLEGGVSV